jgi:hypothetical protein
MFTTACNCNPITTPPPTLKNLDPFHMLNPYLCEIYFNIIFNLDRISSVNPSLHVFRARLVWNRIPTEKLTVVKDFSALYGTRAVVNKFTITHHWALPSAYYFTLLKIHCNAFFPSTPRSSEWSLLYACFI